MKFHRTVLLSALLFAAALPQTARAVSTGQWTGQASVIDGDTVEVRGQRIRLHGIDAPESAQTCMHPSRGKWRCGQQAALALADRIGRRHVTCSQTDTDGYGRAVAVCTLKGSDLNAWMVREGWALAYRKYSRDYVTDETAARTAKRGIWSGDFIPPQDWRRGSRLEEPAKTGNARGCSIKGNISKSGERIYHVPGMRWYGPTRINTAAGERWFCSEADARAAGWRRAQQ